MYQENIHCRFFIAAFITINIDKRNIKARVAQLIALVVDWSAVSFLIF